MKLFTWWRTRKARMAAQRRRITAIERRLRMAEAEHDEAVEVAADLSRRYQQNRFSLMLVEAFRAHR